MSISQIRLPPDVSVEKRREGPDWMWYFRHHALGEIGRIRIASHGSGFSQLICELVGSPDDPMTAQRQAIFEPIGLAVAAALPNAPDIPDPPLPPPSSSVREVVQNNLLTCPTCGAVVARLVFAPATDRGLFEDFARMLFPSFSQWPVPTWIIGPDIQMRHPNRCVNDVLQVLPERHPIRRLTPDDLNPVLDGLAANHCPTRAH
jgi:hypothetical protein